MHHEHVTIGSWSTFLWCLKCSCGMCASMPLLLNFSWLYLHNFRAFFLSPTIAHCKLLTHYLLANKNKLHVFFFYTAIYIFAKDEYWKWKPVQGQCASLLTISFKPIVHRKKELRKKEKKIKIIISSNAWVSNGKNFVCELKLEIAWHAD